VAASGHPKDGPWERYFFTVTERFLPALRQWVQILIREPSAVGAHCKFGCLRCLGMGLYLVARTRLE